MGSSKVFQKLLKKFRKNVFLYFVPIFVFASVFTWALDYSVKNRHFIPYDSPFRTIMSLNDKLTDLKFLFRGEKKGDPRIVVAAIDEKSINKLGKWPWSRHRFAELVRKLKKFGASVVAFDVVFSEADSEDQIRILKNLEQYTDNPKMKKVIRKSIKAVDGDTEFAKAIIEFEKIKSDSGGVVLGFFRINSTSGVKGKNKSSSDSFLIERSVMFEDWVLPEGVSKEETMWSAVGSNYDDHLFRLNIEKISNASDNSGYFSNDPDEDGVFRKYYLAQQIHGKIYPSLALKAVEKYMGDTVTIRIEQEKAFLKFEISEKQVELEGVDLFKTLIDYRGGYGSYPFFSIADIINLESGEINYLIRNIEKDNIKRKSIDLQKAFKDKIVFIGSTVTGAFDMRNTPYDGNYPGVGAHLNVADALLNGRFFSSIVDTLYYSKLFTFFGTLFFGFILMCLNPIGEILFLIISAGILGYIDTKILFENEINIFSLFPIVSILLTYLWITVAEFFTETLEKKGDQKHFQ